MTNRRIAAMTVCMVLIAGVSVFAAADRCVLAQGGKAVIGIVLGVHPSSASRHAAAVLRDRLGRMTGGDFKVTDGDGASGIAVGTCKEFPGLTDVADLKLKERFAPTDLATRQGYVLRSHPRGVQVIGASEMGVIYGAWDLLYRLGYRQFFPDAAWEVVPHLPDAAIAVDVFEKPDYIARRIAGSVTQDWNERNRTSIGSSWKTPMKPYIPECWQKNLIQNQHAWGSIIAHFPKEFVAHPEYMGLVTVKNDVITPDDAPKIKDIHLDNPTADESLTLTNPKEAPQTIQRRLSSKLCVSNPRVRELAARYALDYFGAHPDAPSISLEPSDGGGWCECKACTKIGPPSERVALLVNYVAKALEKDYPGKYIGILAYYTHADAPHCQLHPRIVVSLATALSGKKSMDERLNEWSRVCQNLGVYEYLSVMEWHFGLPAKSRIANLSYLAKKIPYYYQKHVRFFTGQATGGAWGGHGLGYYVLSRLLWDTGEAAHVQDIVDDFLVKAFGDAAAPMREYWRVVDASQAKPGSGAFFLDRASRMYAALRLARKATADPAVRARLDQLVLYTRYVELFAREVMARKSKAHYAALARLVRFSYRIRHVGIVDGYGMRGYLHGARAIPLRPKAVASTGLALSLDEPKPVVAYVDRPITKKEIEAILAGKSVIPVPDAKLPDMQNMTGAAGELLKSDQ